MKRAPFSGELTSTSERHEFFACELFTLLLYGGGFGLRNAENASIARTSLESIHRQSVLRFRHARLHLFGGLLQYGLDLLAIAMVKSSVPLFDPTPPTIKTRVDLGMASLDFDTGRVAELQLYKALLYRKVALH